MSGTTHKTAIVSECGKYRYALGRTWDPSKMATTVFIGLNPSTADSEKDDATIRKCMAYARSWGSGGIVMMNLFAYRTRWPAEMVKAEDPVGPDNNQWLRDVATASISHPSDFIPTMINHVVACWGAYGHDTLQAKRVVSMFQRLECLKQTKCGAPGHPLYLPGNLTPIPYERVK